MRFARFVALFVSVFVFSSVARAQGKGFAVNRYEAPTAGDPSFFVDYPWYSRTRFFAGGLTLNYAHDPLTYGVRSAKDGQFRQTDSIIAHQLSMHIDLAASFLDRVNISISLPVTLLERGHAHDGIAPLSGAAVGDLRIGALVRLYGQSYETPFSIHFGIQLWVPFKHWKTEGDSGVRVLPKLIVAGFYKGLRYSASAGFYYRPEASIGTETPSAGNKMGSEFQLGASIGYWDKVKGFTVAPEALLSTIVIGGKAFQRSYTSAEILLGAHYHIKKTVWIGAAVGLGTLREPGTPDVRALLRVSYAPIRKPKEPPRDSDGDGIIDSRDKCPNDPEDKDGFQDEDGCPDPDNDKDGILDVNDKCPNNPEDKDGFEDEDGCPDPDNDKDGILDVNDKCPLEPEDKDGFEDEDGCPDPDNDKDGVLDVDDKCPLVPGPVENQGCPDPDRDGDGVVDRLDNCPDEPGPAANHGCKTKQLAEIRNGKIEILQAVYFATDKDVILPRSFAVLDNVAQILATHEEIKALLVEGHTDSQGKLAHNMDLSQRRAESVIRYITNKGITTSRMRAQGFGPTKPIADNKTASGRAQNRRVVFTIEGGSTPGIQNDSQGALP